MERAAKERLIGAIVLVTVAWLLIPVFLDRGDEPAGDMIERTLTLPNQAESGAAPLRRETVSLASPEQPADEAAGQAPATVLPAPQPQSQAATDAKDATDATAGAPAAAETISNEDPPARTASPTAAVDNTERAAETAQPVVSSPTPPAATNPASADAASATATSADGATSDGLWAVQLGSFSEQANAQRLAASLRADGLPAFISQVQAGGRTLYRVRIGPQADRPASEAVVRQLAADGQAARVVPHP